MGFDMKRFKKWDFGVFGAFVLTIIGVSIPWWKVKMPDLGDLGLPNLGDLGDLGDLGGLTSAANAIDDLGSASGWNIGVGRAAFAFMLIAALLVLVKAFFPKGRPTPSWYKVSWPLLGIGGLCTIFGIVACVDAPYGGFDFWAWRPGSIITLIAALGLLACAYFMFKDKTGAYDGSGKFALPAMGGQPQPPAGYQQPPAGYQPPAAPPAGGKFCSNCGGPLAPEDAACKNCGKPA
jgi:hypothetical protein